MKAVSGIITLVQEGRFKLLSDDGRPKLFVLSHSASIEPQDLPPLQRAQAHVIVRYQDVGDVIAGIVHEISRTEQRVHSDDHAVAGIAESQPRR